MTKTDNKPAVKYKKVRLRIPTSLLERSDYKTTIGYEGGGGGFITIVAKALYHIANKAEEKAFKITEYDASFKANPEWQSKSFRLKLSAYQKLCEIVDISSIFYDSTKIQAAFQYAYFNGYFNNPS